MAEESGTLGAWTKEAVIRGDWFSVKHWFAERETQSTGRSSRRYSLRSRSSGRNASGTTEWTCEDQDDSHCPTAAHPRPKWLTNRLVHSETTLSSETERQSGYECSHHCPVRHHIQRLLITERRRKGAQRCRDPAAYARANASPLCGHQLFCRQSSSSFSSQVPMLQVDEIIVKFHSGATSS